MSRKIDEFITKEFNNIMSDSRECKAYELGYARGMFALYETIKRDYGKNTADQSFKSFINGDANTSIYFRKMITLSEEEDKNSKEIIKEILRCGKER